MTRKILLSTLLFCFSYGFYAQDSHFSQYNLVPFWLNPAMVAGTNDVDAGLKWGNQFDGASYNSSLPTGESGTYSQQSKIDGSIGFNYQYSKGVHSSIVERAQK